MDEEEDYEMEYHKENDEMDNYNEVGTVVGCSSSRSGLVYDYDETHTHVDDGNFDGRTDDCSPLLLTYVDQCSSCSLWLYSLIFY